VTPAATQTGGGGRDGGKSKELVPTFLRLLAACCTAQPCANRNAALGMHICAASNDSLDPVARACRDAMLHPHHRLPQSDAALG